MSLTDIMSNARLEWFAEAAMIMFAAAFATILIRTLLRSRSEIEYAANIPLEAADNHPTGSQS
ncbi:MAG: hypothetical protein JNG88_07525 [Phycisphaerales bacterium]|nr:hypothetical protein [Phycisphaerales bacterium]